MEAALPAIIVSILWIVGWSWRVRRGLLEEATSRGQVVALVVLVAAVPIGCVVLLISLSRSS
jgi:hypothetical protein